MKSLAVGGELDSYCGRCKMLLRHIIVAMVDSAPKRVKCLTCQHEHNHRLPAKSKSKVTKTKKTTTKKRSTKSSSTKNAWNLKMSDFDSNQAKPYNIFQNFQSADHIQHSKFGPGFVLEICGPDKIIALFESGEKMLMQGQKR